MVKRRRQGKRRGVRGRGRFRKGRYFKSKVGKGEVMVNRTKARLHNVVAPHYMTRLEYGFSGNFQGATAGSQGYFNVWANGLTTPGDKIIQGATSQNNFVDFTDAGFGGNLYPATHALTALNPVGIAQLAPLYSRYRVYASKIDVTCTPTLSTEPFLMSLLPLNQDALGGAFGSSSAIPGNDIQRAMSCPYAKCIQVNNTNNIKQNRLSMYMDIPTIVGYTKQQYQDDPNTTAVVDTSNPGLNGTSQGQYVGAFWQVNISPMGNSIELAGYIELRVTYWVELFDPIPPSDTT